VLDLPTAFWHEWVRDLATLGASPPESVRLVIVGGEKALGTALAEWRALAGEHLRWINTYGPTEASVIATAWEAPAGEQAEADPPIGRPIRGVRAYVLDAHAEPVPIGVPGELHLGGAAVALGYLGRPELTVERFVPDPFEGEGVLYRTGDLVKHRTDGVLEFVARTDHQLKIRGFRVEPDEVAAALREHPAVEDALVAGLADQRGAQRLAAYVVHRPDGTPTVPELRRFLRQRLPAYMVPSAYALLDAFPLTPNGKVDRSRLPRPSLRNDDAGAEFVAPRNDRETQLAAIWTQVLGVERIGVHDDFFSLGGHSLLATQVISRLRESCGLDVELRAIFESPTIAELAERAAATPVERGAAAIPVLAARPRRAVKLIELNGDGNGA
jgi:acyl-CoA synthetase (AMP-forming)/AMP-acid ligase II